MFCRSLFVPLSYFSLVIVLVVLFALRLLITPLVYSTFFNIYRHNIQVFDFRCFFYFVFHKTVCIFTSFFSIIFNIVSKVVVIFFNDYLEWRDISNLIFDHFHLTFVSFILFAIYIFVSIDYFTLNDVLFVFTPICSGGFMLHFYYMYICTFVQQDFNVRICSSPLAITEWVPLVAQDQCTLPEHMRSLSVSFKVLVVKFLVFCVVFCRSLFIILYVFSFCHCVVCLLRFTASD